MPTLRSHHGSCAAIRHRSARRGAATSNSASEPVRDTYRSRRENSTCRMQPERDADRGERVVDRQPAAGRQELRPAQVVRQRPVVVLAVDVEEVDRLPPARPQLGALGLPQLDPVGHPGGGQVGQEHLPGRQAAEHRAADERIDRHHPGPGGGQHHGGAALMAADLDDQPAGRHRDRLLPQQPGLLVGQPAADAAGDGQHVGERGQLLGRHARQATASARRASPTRQRSTLLAPKVPGTRTARSHPVRAFTGQ